MSALTLNEDDLYRTSSQYRLWSFSPTSLASLRQTTHETATDRVIKAIKRHRTLSSTSQSASTATNTSTTTATAPAPPAEDAPINTLSLPESARILNHYYAMLLRFAGTSNKRAFQFDAHIGATAVQFLRRFYLTNSPMTYHPKEIMFTALWLAMKSEAVPRKQINLKMMVDKLKRDMNIKSISEEQILASEFIVAQGLRFTLDVRHPFRGVKGGVWELGAIARGEGKVGGPEAAELQREMLGLEMPKVKWEDGEGMLRPLEVTGVEALGERVRDAGVRADGLLVHDAQLTDAYFLYTPAQLHLGALWLADEPLAEFYLGLKLDAVPEEVRGNIRRVIAQCAETIASYSPPVEEEQRAREKEELTAIDKKLYKCRNPDKLDLVGLNNAQKRKGEGITDEVRQAKKAKVDEGRKEMEGVFGPPLGAG